MEEKKIIEVPFKIVVIIIVVMIAFFTIVIVNLNVKSRNSVKATQETEIPLTQITSDQRYGSLRGGIFYDKNNYVSTSATLIGNNTFDKSIWLDDGPIIDFDTIPYVYSLDDLKVPYLLYKKANNDTINVIKDEYIIKFLLTND